ncbi:RHS repeat protein, partial [Clostridium sp. D2Q-11]|nr:RHS repeat protein [Anaeromonas frigoriresistens]
YEKEEYKYDPLNQLVEVKNRNEENRKYFYDSLGNRAGEIKMSYIKIGLWSYFDKLP